MLGLCYDTIDNDSLYNYLEKGIKVALLDKLTKKKNESRQHNITIRKRGFRASMTVKW
ncbi:MAG: hypothetical protein ACLSG8_08255 [Barnesiella sp.]